MSMLNRLPALTKYPARRLYSTTSTSVTSLKDLNVEALDKWISSEKKLTLSDIIRPEHLANLYVTIPTRDGSKSPYRPPTDRAPLGYGHHLVFFHHRTPEHALRWDGTDPDFCPPEPFTRRMWAGGKIRWKNNLLIGDKTTAVSTVRSVEKKGFENDSPLVFVNQHIEYTKEGDEAAAIEEERSHVYLAAPATGRGIKLIRDLPEPEFSLEFLPTPRTLFRFSALTFNGHFIHLDREYARKSEGYKERLVHGPLTALMMLETAALRNPGAVFTSFEYRAHNPLVVNKAITIHGARESNDSLRVWAVGSSGAVGMTGTITCKFI